MHFAFIPYGKRSEVELLLRDMEAQKHKLNLYNDKEELVKTIWIQGQVRELPLGVIEYVFPKEDLDNVLNTLIGLDHYELPKVVLASIRKFYKLEKIPKFKDTNKYLWIKDHVNIIPIGIRKDTDNQPEEKGDYEGLHHEGI